MNSLLGVPSPNILISLLKLFFAIDIFIIAGTR